VKHLSGAPHQGRLLASPTNIRLSWKGLPETNTLAYSVNYGCKKFYRTGPWLEIAEKYKGSFYFYNN